MLLIEPLFLSLFRKFILFEIGLVFSVPHRSLCSLCEANKQGKKQTSKGRSKEANKQTSNGALARKPLRRILLLE